MSVKSLTCILTSRLHIVHWIPSLTALIFIRPEVSQKPRNDTEDRAESVCEAHLRREGCFRLAADKIRQVLMLRIPSFFIR